MKMMNEAGQAVYHNSVEKHGNIKFVVLAASGQTILGRDREKRKSRTFTHQHQAESWLKRNGYKPCG